VVLVRKEEEKAKEKRVKRRRSRRRSRLRGEGESGLCEGSGNEPGKDSSGKPSYGPYGKVQKVREL
jgi:hypothetical protein